MISTDRNIFKEGSPVRARMVEYGTLSDELHIIVFAKKYLDFVPKKISDRVWIHPTNSVNRWFYVKDAVSLGKKIIADSKLEVSDSVITVQDPFETGLAGWRIAKKTGLKFHVQIHTDFLSPYFKKFSFLNSVRVFVASFILPKADGIRVVSNRIKSSITTHNFRLKTTPVVLPIYTDISRIIQSPKNIDLHEKYPQFKFIILMASRLAKEKNIGLAIRAFKKIIKKYPQTGLIIVGEGLEKRKLKKITRFLGLKHSIIFEPWTNDLASYYKSSNAYLLTSWYEGYGLTLVEAAACGCPIVTSDVGVAGEIAVDEKNAFVCPVSDGVCLTEKILQLIAENDLRKRFSMASEEILRPLASFSKDQYFVNYKKSLELCFLQK